MNAWYGRLGPIGLCKACILVCALAAHAQEPALEAKVNRSEIVEGVGFELTFVLKYAETEDFTPPDFKGFRVLSGPHLMTGFAMINRTYFRHQSRIYELQALKAGVYTIGPATAVVNGKTIRSKPIRIRVSPVPAPVPRASTPAPISPSTEDFELSARCTPQSVYVGQQLIWQLRIYAARPVDYADVVQLPDFSGFSHRERRRFDNRVLPDTLRGRAYSAKTLYEQALFPIQSGTPGIGGAAARIEVLDDVGVGRIAFPRAIGLKADSLRVVVRPLPVPAPADFCGGVGDYAWEVRYPETREYGPEDAIVIEATLSGNGDPRRVKAPKWPLPEGLDRSEPRLLQEDIYETESGFRHAFTYQYVIFPQKSGVYSVWPHAVFFNPEKHAYDTLRADSAWVFAVRGERVGSRSDVGVGAENETRGWGAGQWGALAVVLSSIALLVFFYRRHKSRRAKDTLPSVARTAARSEIPAERLLQIRELAGRGADDLFCHELLTLLSDILTGQLGIAPSERGSARIFEELARRQTDPELVARLKNLWQTCELSAYGGVPLRDGALPTLDAATDMLNALNKQR